MGVRMENESAGSLEREGASALSHMEEALELLDQCDGADDVGAQLDLAISRLKDRLAQAKARSAQARI